MTDVEDKKIYAYTRGVFLIYPSVPYARDPNNDFNTLQAAGNNLPRDLWSDGTTMWVADSDDDKIYAYNLFTKARDPNNDFNTLQAAGNNSLFGLWSDGTTLWVTDSDDDKIYAYNLSTKARDPNNDFNTLIAAGNENPYGLWSDGSTMWVTDRTDDKLYAYNLSTKARDPNNDFNTLQAAGNNDPLWPLVGRHDPVGGGRTMTASYTPITCSPRPETPTTISTPYKPPETAGPVASGRTARPCG